jgi:hypothetical protein
VEENTEDLEGHENAKDLEVKVNAGKNESSPTKLDTAPNAKEETTDKTINASSPCLYNSQKKI